MLAKSTDMYVVLFGAGASYGSDNSNVPSLGNNLMDALAQFAPNSWGALPQKYKDQCKKDFEQGVLLLSQEQPFMLPRLQRAMAAYFFKFALGVNSLYLKFANRIKRSNWNLKGHLVTLNYERLLTHSLFTAGLQPIVGSEPVNKNQIEVCLPHGICNLFCESVQATGGVSFSLGVGFDGELKFVEELLDFNNRILGNAIPPVMCYFEPQKRTNAGNNFILNQRNRYAELIHNSSKVALIGLKVRPLDTHIWNPLAQTNAELVYCSGTKSCNEFLDWSKTARPDKANKVLEGYFSAQFENICSELEL